MNTFRELAVGDIVYFRAFSRATLNWYFEAIPYHVYKHVVNGVMKKYLSRVTVASDGEPENLTDNRLDFEAHPDDYVCVVDINDTRRLVYATEERLLDVYLKDYMMNRLDEIEYDIEDLKAEQKAITEKLCVIDEK